MVINNCCTAAHFPLSLEMPDPRRIDHKSVPFSLVSTIWSDGRPIIDTAISQMTCHELNYILSLARSPISLARFLISEFVKGIYVFFFLFVSRIFLFSGSGLDAFVTGSGKFILIGPTPKNIRLILDCLIRIIVL